ncbi:uncharacterized protein LOC108672375 [Hyalella azteca]|uniref:Uncharacterized protein LOC108672375 n=1 Tax=Hyalella azteca TaxID=294128 RepID=A0A8B7NP88_HYAAZ|nr:uncharacterized protein LOC108672375 [Hyalella azteca]
MDLWNRLFHTRKNFEESHASQIHKSDGSDGQEVPLSPLRNDVQIQEQRAASDRRSRCSSRGFEISTSGIRVLLFRECERRGRMCIYDSSTILRVPVSTLNVSDESMPLTTAPVRGIALLTTPSAGVLHSTQPRPETASTGSNTRLSSASGNPSTLPAFRLRTLGPSRSSGCVLSNPLPVSDNVRASSNETKDSFKSYREASRSSDPISSYNSPSTARPTQPRKTEVIMEITEDHVYQFCRQASDSKQLGELVFGSVELAYRGPCSKLHTLPGRVLLSRVQPRPPPPAARGGYRGSGIPPHPAAPHRHPTLASDAGISSMGSSLEVLGRLPSGATDPSSDSVNFYLGGSSSSDRRRLSSLDKRRHRSDVPEFRRTSTTVSDVKSSFGGSSVFCSTAGFPEPGCELRRTSTSPSEDDSGFGGPASWLSATGGSFAGLLSLPVTPVGSVSSKGSLNSSSGSLSNLQKRYLRRTTDTSLDCLASPSCSSFSPPGGDAGVGKNSTLRSRESKLHVDVASPACGDGGVAAASHGRIGLAVVLSAEPRYDCAREQLALERWVVLQAPLLEGCINRLQAALDVAYHSSSSFVSRAHAAVAAFQRELLDLLYGPRVTSALWLEILSTPAASQPLASSSDSGLLVPAADALPRDGGAELDGKARRQALSAALVGSLRLLLQEHDTKQTNFFMSRLLTAVLTYHLGWVTSVALREDAAAHIALPVTTATMSAAADYCSDSSAPGPGSSQPFFFHQPQENESGLLTQLLELQGCLGHPPQCCRTVLLGSSPSLLQHCLSLLSYLVRCQQVEERGVLPGECLNLFPKEEVVAEIPNPRIFRNTVTEPNISRDNSSSILTEHTQPSKLKSNVIAESFTRNSSEVTLQRSSSSGSCRRSSDDSNCKVSSSECSPAVSGHTSTALYRKRSSIQGMTGTALETLSELGSPDLNFRKHEVTSQPEFMLTDQKCQRVHNENLSVNVAVSQHSFSNSGDEEMSNDQCRSSYTDTAKTETIVSKASISLKKIYDQSERDNEACNSNLLPTETHVSSVSATKSIPTSKTSFNLTDLSNSLSSLSDSTLKEQSSLLDKSESRRSSRSSLTAPIYPDLSTLDCHREVFGPAEFQPDVIAAKVRKLCRTTPDRITHEGESSRVSSSGSSEVMHKFTRKASSDRGLSDKISQDESACTGVSPLSENNSGVVDSTQGSLINTEQQKRPVRSDADDVKKVIFVIGEDDDDLGGSSPKTTENAHTCSPHPRDFLEMRESRNVARAVCLDGLAPETFGGVNRSGSERWLKRDHILGHKRTSSDPTAKRRGTAPNAAPMVSSVATTIVPTVVSSTTKTCVVFEGKSPIPTETYTLASSYAPTSAAGITPSVKNLVTTRASPTRTTTAMVTVDCSARNMAASLTKDSAPSDETSDQSKKSLAPTIPSAHPANVAVVSPVDAIISATQLRPAADITTAVTTGPVAQVSCSAGFNRAISVPPAGSPVPGASSTNFLPASSDEVISNAMNFKAGISKDENFREAVRPGTDVDPTTQVETYDVPVREKPSRKIDTTKRHEPKIACVFLPEPSVDVCSPRSVLGVAEGVIGGVLDRYSPVYVLQAVINTDSEHFNSRSGFGNSGSASRFGSESSARSITTYQPSSDRSAYSLQSGRPSSLSSALECETKSTVQGTLAFASSLFGTSPTRLFGGSSTKTNAPSLGRTEPSNRAGLSSADKNARCETSKSVVLKALRLNLAVDARFSQFKVSHNAILADFDDWSVNIVTSDSDGIVVGMSPLIASITDSLLQLVLLGADPDTVLQCLDDKLSEVYRQSLVLANYLLGGTTVLSESRDREGNVTLNARTKVGINPSRLADLPSALGLDLNDLPLLLATASSHSPHLATMYGLAIR